MFLAFCLGVRAARVFKINLLTKQKRAQCRIPPSPTRTFRSKGTGECPHRLARRVDDRGVARAGKSGRGACGAAAQGRANVAIDFAGVARLDTAGAWLIDKARAQIAAAGAATEYAEPRHRPDHPAARGGLSARLKPRRAPRAHLRFMLLQQSWRLERHDRRQYHAGRRLSGRTGGGGAARHVQARADAADLDGLPHGNPSRLRAVPIIVTINFLVGCIVDAAGHFPVSALRRADLRH